MRSWGKYITGLIPIFCLSIATTSAQTQKPNPSAKKLRSTFYSASDIHPTPAWIVDVLQQAGLTLENVNKGVDTKEFTFESTGSGVAIIDYDNDGGPDIFLRNGSTLDDLKGPNKPCGSADRFITMIEGQDAGPNGS
jgi:hypothetical protein